MLSRFWLATAIVILSSAPPAPCQSVSVGQLARAARVTNGTAPSGQSVTLAAADTSCQTKLQNLPRWWLPLALADDATVVCFYQASGPVDPVSQVGFLYGFGGGDSKTISADLASMQFGGGLQATLGQSVTMGTSTTTTVTTTTTPANGTPQQTTSTQTMDSPDTAIAKLQQGGDIFARFNYPLAYGNADRWGGVVSAVPKITGNFSGFGSNATITQANEYNVNISVEGYGEWRAIGDAGLAYGSVRTGWQYVQPEFARKIGLGTKNTFQMTQIAVGLEFSQLVRFGVQKFFGPSAAFATDKNELSRWHLVLQLVPKKRK